MANTARVRRPHWNGKGEHEFVVVVSSGEPTRTPDEMAYWVRDQANAYLGQHTDVLLSYEELDRLVHYIVWMHYDRPRLISLSRDGLLAAVDTIKGRQSPWVCHLSPAAHWHPGRADDCDRFCPPQTVVSA